MDSKRRKKSSWPSRVTISEWNIKYRNLIHLLQTLKIGIMEKYRILELKNIPFAPII